jgi:FAD-NAD(P)-binding
MATAPHQTLAIIGGGPRAAGILERIAANASLLGAEQRLRIHVIDPYPPGAGRIWRHAQSPLLRLNSMAEDVTMFTDESSVIDGPIVPGPSLIEWARGVRDGSITDVAVSGDLADQLESLTGTSFPTRQLQSVYLDWVYRRAVDALPESVTVSTHAAAAIAVEDWHDGAQWVVLDTGERIRADIVLYALGHTSGAPDGETVGLERFAERHGLAYLPPSFTADADTSALAAGEPVIVRGMGLAAVDLVVLLTEGRGGRFEERGGGLVYVPSGREPQLFLGSRRGVPYRSKISSRLAAPRPAPRFFTAEIAQLLERELDEIDFRRDVWPLIAKELQWGYYHELFVGHPDRVTVAWPAFVARFEALGFDDPRFAQLLDDTVLDPIDRLTLPGLDRPLAGAGFESPAALQEHLREHIRTDLRLRSAPEHSATLGLFSSLLFAMFDLGSIVDSPKWSAGSRLHDLPVWWLNLFSYIASGPPPRRLEELLALSEAGIVEFLGPEVQVHTDDAGFFVASSPSVEREVVARALVDARLPATRIASSENPTLRDLVESGVGSEEYVSDASAEGSTGRLRVRRPDARVLDPHGAVHPRRFAIGAYTNAPFVGAFARPRTNAVSFRENDRVARAILELANDLAGTAGLPTTLERVAVG